MRARRFHSFHFIADKMRVFRQTIFIFWFHRIQAAATTILLRSLSFSLAILI